MEVGDADAAAAASTAAWSTLARLIDLERAIDHANGATDADRPTR
jgi:hypothetical protein